MPTFRRTPDHTTSGGRGVAGRVRLDRSSGLAPGFGQAQTPQPHQPRTARPPPDQQGHAPRADPTRPPTPPRHPRLQPDHQNLNITVNGSESRYGQMPQDHPNEVWRVKDSNLGRHQPTDLQSAAHERRRSCAGSGSRPPGGRLSLPEDLVDPPGRTVAGQAGLRDGRA